MAFVVGDALTLGAMVRGDFMGNVRWQVGGRELSFAMDTGAGSWSDVQVAGPSTLGQGAHFRGTTWINLELPLIDFIDLADGGALQLRFEPERGPRVTLPDEGYHYVTTLVRR